jgi:hypothetical protein
MDMNASASITQHAPSTDPLAGVPFGIERHNAAPFSFDVTAHDILAIPELEGVATVTVDRWRPFFPGDLVVGLWFDPAEPDGNGTELIRRWVPAVNGSKPVRIGDGGGGWQAAGSGLKADVPQVATLVLDDQCAISGVVVALLDADGDELEFE